MAYGHEESDVNVHAIFTFCVGLIVTALIIHGMVWLLFRFFDGRENTRGVAAYPLAAGRETRLPPEPRLQTHPRDDLNDLTTREEAWLNTYGWVNRPAGVVRIPIEEAMKLTIQRGLPARPANGATQK